MGVIGISIWVCEFKNYSAKIQVLKIKFAHIPFLGTLLLIFGMLCMEAELKQPRCGTKSSRARKYIMLM
jgi:hypothetical protein